MVHSQPLSEAAARKLGLSDADREFTDMTERNIKSQRIGRMFDDFEERRSKVTLQTRMGWKARSVKWKYNDVRYAVRNLYRWYRTITSLRPWAGFDGMLHVMITHMEDYIQTEIKYGLSEKTYKQGKIDSAKEAVGILKRLRRHDEYLSNRRNAVDVRYPDYLQLVTEYVNGGASTSGYFVKQGSGWAGHESGKDPREGYFEFVNDRFEKVDSPDQSLTDMLLAEIKEYHAEIQESYKQAKEDIDKDFDRLAQLFKEHMYSWWD